MKRLTGILLVICMLSILCSAAIGEKEALPQAAFPLADEAIITAALEKAGLTGEISETETVSYGEGHILHVVRSLADTYSDSITPEEAQTEPASRVLVAGISSVMYEGERMLSVIFDQKEVPEQFNWEDWQRQIVFATLLYGGFESEEAVYQACLSLERPEGEDRLAWELPLPGGYCQVQYSPRNDHTLVDEYGLPAGKRSSGTLIIKIYETRELFEKHQAAYAQEK